MRTSDPIRLAGVDFYFSIKELELDEIRAWMMAQGRNKGGVVSALLSLMRPEKAVAEVVDALLFEDFDVRDVLHLTTVTQAQLGRLTPAQIRQVWELAKQVNTDFFAMRARMLEAGKKILSVPLNQALPS